MRLKAFCQLNNRCSLVSSVWPGHVYRTVCTSTGSPSCSPSLSLSLPPSLPLSLQLFQSVATHEHTVTPAHLENTHAQSPSVCLERREGISSPSTVFIGTPTLKTNTRHGPQMRAIWKRRGNNMDTRSNMPVSLNEAVFTHADTVMHTDFVNF